MKSLAVWIAFTFLPLCALAEAAVTGSTEITQNCYHANEGGERWTYCVHRVNPSVNADVIYFLHGANGNADSWANSPYFRRIYDAWGTQAPTVVSVSYGSVWLLAEKNTSAYSGLYTHFVKVALPSIEKEQALVPARRLLAGASMGGFNSAQLYLKNPELFSKVALLCPALSEVGPYSGDDAIEDYITRTGASRALVNNSLYLTRLFFPTRAAYLTADPLPLARERVTRKSPDLLVSIGLQDGYGFFEGAEKFSEIAKSKGARATYVTVQGAHCTWDWKAVTQFLVEP
jgi:pimeloyl-ACP methyl ester carboxylesterase